MNFKFWRSRNSVEQNNQPIADEVFFDQLRKKEFSRIDKNNHCYLDFTGGNLYPESLLNQHYKYLHSEVYGNPHSGNPTAQLSTQQVQEARNKVLVFFNAADDYFCIFTANASGALHIVGECYPFDAESTFLLTADNHNSVNGIREYCKMKKGSVGYAVLNYEDLKINKQKLEQALCDNALVGHKLFAFPAQSNVSGVKHDLSWIDYAQQKGWDVLLDAAAYVPSSALDLKKVKPDFVSVSFYKIFGYPTGLGCLLVRKDKFSKLKKPWFAGGTVTLVSVNYQSHFLANDHERFENGTVDYLGIPAIGFGIDFVNKIGIERLKNRVSALSSYFKKEVERLHHSNGTPIIKLFGPEDLDCKGGTFILNFRDAHANVFAFEEIEKRANQFKISIRTGCFCNPGIDEINNCLTNDELAKYFTSRDLGNYHDMIHFLGKMRGAVRVSVGWATVQADLDRFIAFVRGFKDEHIG